MRYYPIQKKKFEKDEVIFSEDTQGDGMYIIETGRVRVFKTILSADGKKEIELCTLGPKAMFGEMSIIDDNPRSATVQAVSPTVCTVITRKIFEEQLEHIPVWMVNMIKILVMRLRETNDKLRTIIEQYGPNAPADTGRVITVDEDASTQKEGAAHQTMSQTRILEAAAKKHYRSEDIVKDLYK
jgi:CRP-like cAMP-binding protein